MLKQKCWLKKFPDKTLVLLGERLKTQDYLLLIKRLDQYSVTLNFRNNSREFFEIMKILGVFLETFYIFFNF